MMALTRVIQGPQEPFSEFVARLQEVADRVLGPGEDDSNLLQQVAYENANLACRSVLKGQTKNKTLRDLVRLCSDVDVFSHKVSQSINLAIGAALQVAKGSASPQKIALNVASLDILHYGRNAAALEMRT